ncbi:MFS transporter [Neomicrococcus lactis]
MSLSAANQPEFSANIVPSRRTLTKQVWAWASWDWGSAAFNAVMTTFVFTVYLTSSLFGNEDQNSAVLGAGISIAGVLIALLAPVIGQRSDSSGRRRFWLGVNTFLIAALTALCFFVYPSPNFLLMGVILIAAGNVFSEFASVNYNAMLTQISTPKTIGQVSGFGWGMGYLGGIVALAIVLFGFVQPVVDWWGSSSEDSLNLRLVAIFSALWIFIFGLPVLFAVPENKGLVKERVGFFASYQQLFRHVAHLWKTDRHTVWFLISSAIFRDGLAAVFTFGGVIASVTFGFTLSQVIIFAIVGNVVAALGAMFGGWLDDRIGPKKVILGSLIGLLIAGLGVFFSPGPAGFWVFGLFLCLFVGPAQSSSRAYLARLTESGREGELFGLYATTGRAVSFLAPSLFTAAVAIALNFFPDGGAQRYGILGIMVVLAAGFLLLLPVKATGTRSRPPATLGREQF